MISILLTGSLRLPPPIRLRRTSPAVRSVNRKEGPFMGRLRAYFDRLAHPMQDVHINLREYSGAPNPSQRPIISNDTHSKKALTLSISAFSVNQQLPILPGRFQPSTFGVCELNYRVRHGYGCILTAIATESLRVSVLSKLYRRKVFRRALATWSRL